MDAAREKTPLRRLPSVDQVLKAEAAAVAIERFGRPQTVVAVRQTLDAARAAVKDGDPPPAATALAADAHRRLEAASRSSVRPVFNLTGTVLHTNLGRAILAEEAVQAAITAMRQPMALEFDLDGGKRGERDALVRELLTGLTGAEDATVVNNNAAAALIALNTFARDREAVVSRGELIEIGGAFRMPDIMARAGARIVEVGTTNRTHLRDYAGAMTPQTGLILKVHTSNYRIEGFTREVGARELAGLSRERGVPLIHDLGSGTLVDLSRWGLVREPTVADAVADGADLVTFSGDKLLGGPQAGFVVGRKELVEKINKNPMKRAMRVDKVRLAALEATLRLYLDPDRLAGRLPTLRFLSRPKSEIESLAERLRPLASEAVGATFTVAVIDCVSQIGSGSLPLETIPSAGLALRPAGRKVRGSALTELSAVFRALPIPVIGRIADQAFVLDLRCLEDDVAFAGNLRALRLPGRA